MADITNEMKEKLLVAKSAEEADALLKESGVDETTAKHLWEELNRKREANGGKLRILYCSSYQLLQSMRI